MHTPIILVLLLLLSAMPACNTVVERYDEGPAPAVHNPHTRIRMNTVNILDRTLQQWPSGSGKRFSKVAVEGTSSRRTPTGTLEVWAVLRNRTDFPMHLEGRTQFFDAGEAPIEGPTPWKRLFIPPQGMQTYRTSSTLTGDVNFYYIEIREGR